MSPFSESTAENDDAFLIAQIQRGDPEAFERLLDRYLRGLHLFVALKSPMPDWIDPITQQTFDFAFHNLKNLQPTASLRPWLQAIAWNLIRTKTQKFRHRPKLPAYVCRLLHQMDREHSNLKASDEPEYFENALSQLPERAAELLRLKYGNGETIGKIAGHASCSIAAAQLILFRIRQRLHARLEKRHEETEHAD